MNRQYWNSKKTNMQDHQWQESKVDIQTILKFKLVHLFLSHYINFRLMIIPFLITLMSIKGMKFINCSDNNNKHNATNNKDSIAIDFIVTIISKLIIMIAADHTTLISIMQYFLNWNKIKKNKDIRTTLILFNLKDKKKLISCIRLVPTDINLKNR